MEPSESPVNVHFHDSVQINIHPPSPPGAPPRWDDPPPPILYGRSTTSDNRLPLPTPPLPRNETRAFHRIFLKAKPRSRGTIQIFVAHFQLALGIAFIYIGGRNYTWYSYITFWAPPILVASGFLAVRAEAVKSYKLVKSCFILHTIGGTASLAGVVLCAADVFMITPCGFTCPYGNMGTLIILSILMTTNLLQLLSSGIIAVYGFQAMKSETRNQPQNHPVQSPSVIPSDPPSYSEVSSTLSQYPGLSQPTAFILSPTYLIPADLGPPPFINPLASTDLPPPPDFSETADLPPPYSE